MGMNGHDMGVKAVYSRRHGSYDRCFDSAIAYPYIMQEDRTERNRHSTQLDHFHAYIFRHEYPLAPKTEGVTSGS